MCGDCGHFAFRHVGHACQFPRDPIDPCLCQGMLWDGHRFEVDPTGGPVDDEPAPTPEQMDAMLHAMVWGSGTEQADAMTCGHLITMHDEDGCNEPFCGCGWGSDEIGRYSPADQASGTCGRPLAVRRAEKGPL